MDLTLHDPPHPQLHPHSRMTSPPSRERPPSPRYRGLASPVRTRVGIALAAALLIGAAFALLLVPSEAADAPSVPPPTGMIAQPSTPSAGPSGPRYRAVADATVQAARPSTTDGSSESLRSAVWPEVRSYVRFDVSDVSGDVTDAVLTLRALTSSRSGFEIYLADGPWQEESVTFANAPPLTRVLASSGPIEREDRVRLDVTPAIDGPGSFTFAIVTSARRSVTVASRESGDPAVLSVTTGRWCKGVMIRPGDSIQDAIDEHGEGTTFCIQAGVHRLEDPVYPLDRQRFIGQDGAILSGSKLLTDLTREGSFWVADGQRQDLPGAGVGECKSGYEGCTFPERVFMDDVSLWQVTSLSQLSAGEFFFDHEADKIYVADDPQGHRVETTVAPVAIEGWPGTGVRVSDLIIEKFGAAAQESVLGDVGARGWVIVGNELRNNAGIGIAAGSNTLVRANYVHEQGQMGMGGQQAGATYMNNTVSDNNVDGFAPGWEAGGAKWVATSRMTAIGNYVHDNNGNGFWTDGNNFETRYLNNRIEDNQGLGIIHEISYDAVIRNNYIANNGVLTQAELDGAGIMVASSSNVDVSRNTVIGNADGIALKQHSAESGDRGEFLVGNVYIHKNVILMCQGETGAIQTVGDDGYIFTSRNNRFDHNTYLVGTDHSLWWRWLNDFQDWDHWVGFDQDVHGTFRTTDC